MADIQPGDVVEWNPEHVRRPCVMRGTVTRLVNGTVYLRIHRHNKKNESEVWFEPSEVHRLRVVNAIASEKGCGK